VRQQFYIAWIAVFFAILLWSCHAVHNSSVSAAVDSVKNSTRYIPYHTLDSEDDLDVLTRAVGDARVVMLGESTHGTHEYYTWRAAITKKLVQEKGFDFVAIEGDWDDSYKVNQFIHGPQSDSGAVIDILRQYDRWPSSMWGNYEMAGFIQWLNRYNQGGAKKIGYYGLDLYSFWEWTEQRAMVADTAVQNATRQMKDFFAPYQNDAMIYADSVLHSNRDGSAVTRHLWSEVQRSTHGKQPKDEAGFNLYQHAWLALIGEQYFRTLVKDHLKAINIRDGYMAETLKRLLSFYGPQSKVVVWAHNGHTGDARYSTMSSSGYINLGQILREELGGANVFSVGFGTYKGTVMAGYTWNGHLQKQTVLPAKGGTREYLLHDLSASNKIILSKDIRNNAALNKWIEFRSIGAAYEGAAIYTRSIMPKRFDAFIFIDSTSALHPISDTD